MIACASIEEAISKKDDLHEETFFCIDEMDAFVMKYEKDLSQLKLFVKFLDEVVKKRPLVCLSATVDVTESNQKNLEDRLWKVLGFTMYPYAESAGK